MANFYVNSIAYAIVAQWAASTVYSSSSNGGRGDYVRQLAVPAVGSERVFRCTTPGTSNTVEPTWVLTRNATTADTNGTGAGNVVWTECTGQEADQIVGTFKAPHARLRNALASGWAAAGDTVFCSSNHAGTQASALTLTSLGTLASPINILCISSSLPNIPPASGDLTANGASEACTVGALTVAGWLYNYGVNIGPCASANGISLSNGAGSVQRYEQMTFNSGSASGVLVSTGAASKTDWLNVTYAATVAGSIVHNVNGDLFWKGGSATFSTNTVFSQNTGDTGSVFCEGVDFSALASGKKLVTAGNANACVDYFFKDCNVPAGVTIDTPIGPCTVSLTRTDGSPGNNQFAKYDIFGTENNETTITRVGGAAGPDGVLFSKKIVTTANSKWTFPFASRTLGKWNALTGATRTVTVYGTINAGSVPNNDDIWLEVEYLGTGGILKGSYVNTTKTNVLAAGSPVSSDGSSWNGGGSGAGWSPFSLSLTLTAQVAAPFTVRVIAAKASTTWYIDSKVYLS